MICLGFFEQEILRAVSRDLSGLTTFQARGGWNIAHVQQKHPRSSCMELDYGVPLLRRSGCGVKRPKSQGLEASSNPSLM